MKNFSARKITQAAAIAAIYIVLTYITNLFGLANGVVQVRVSEALAVLPYFTATSIPGLFIGCLLSNILTGCIAMDVIFGSIATLIGAVAGRYLSKINKYLTPVPTVISNMIIVPLVLKYAYGIPGSVWYYNSSARSEICLRHTGQRVVFYAHCRGGRDHFLLCYRDSIHAVS